jgi:hypothetical protein
MNSVRTESLVPKANSNMPSKASSRKEAVKEAWERKGSPGRISSFLPDAVALLTPNLHGEDRSPRCATLPLIRLQLPRKIRFLFGSSAFAHLHDPTR